MRYYKLIVSNAAGQVYVPNALGGFDKVAPGANVSSFASHLPTSSGGLQYNPGSLQIEFDYAAVGTAAKQGNAIIRVSGVGLAMIGRATDLNPDPNGVPTTNVALYAGMQQGIAGASGLANPKQAGLILQGQILQAFGNWQGVNQSLDVIAINGTVDPPAGISWNWQPGTPLAAALFITLQQAFPTFKVTVNTTTALQPQGPQAGVYLSLPAFTSYLQGYTQTLGAALGLKAYTGVNIVIVGNTLVVYDFTAPIKTTTLNFQDLIGQPTWIDASSVNFKTVLRADINVGDNIIFPAGVIAPYALTSPEAAVPGAPSRSKTVFQGAFNVLEAHHFANYRQPDAESWNTTFRAVALGT